jgi:methionine-R-sulfoxide reductase
MRGSAIVVGFLWLTSILGCGRSEAAPPDGDPAAAAGKAAATTVRVRLIGKDGEIGEPVTVPKVVRTDEEWRERLTPEQYAITRRKGTERPFCGGLLHEKGKGVFVCIGCDLPLFASGTKFDSGTGWPSFFRAIAPENVLEEEDRSHGMMRTEILCARCDGHLGHVFDDGPAPTGRRFCLNSESLRFVAEKDLPSLAEAAPAPPAGAPPGGTAAGAPEAKAPAPTPSSGSK